VNDLVVLQPVEREKLALRIMTISQAADLWLGELAREQKTARTRDTYRRCLDKLADAYPYADVDEITPTMCRRFIDRWQHKSPATLAGIISCLNRFFGWLEDEKVIRRSPMTRIMRPKLRPAEDNDDVITVSSADVDRLFAAVAGWDELLALSVLTYLGPRRHAAAVLRLSDYDRDERTLLFHEKGGKNIRKPCPDRLAEVIEAAIAAGVYEEAPGDYLIPSKAEQRRKGDRDDRIILRLVQQVAARAGVTTHAHALRAAFAVRFMEAKPGELLALKKLMGHRRIETTLVYLRRLRRRQAMETVRDLVWGDNAGLPQNPGIQFEANRGTEKEGFEPSFNAKAHGNRAGFERGEVVPLDEALKRRIRETRGPNDKEADMSATLDEKQQVIRAIREHARKHESPECVWCDFWDAYCLPGRKDVAIAAINEILERADEGEVFPSDLPTDLLTRLRALNWGEADWTAKDVNEGGGAP
jgi:site-specific recombinase XerD